MQAKPTGLGINLIQLTSEGHLEAEETKAEKPSGYWPYLDSSQRRPWTDSYWPASQGATPEILALDETQQGGLSKSPEAFAAFLRLVVGFYSGEPPAKADVDALPAGFDQLKSQLDKAADSNAKLYFMPPEGTELKVNSREYRTYTERASGLLFEAVEVGRHFEGDDRAAAFKAIDASLKPVYDVVYAKPYQQWRALQASNDHPDFLWIPGPRTAEQIAKLLERWDGWKDGWKRLATDIDTFAHHRIPTDQTWSGKSDFFWPDVSRVRPKTFEGARGHSRIYIGSLPFSGDIQITEVKKSMDGGDVEQFEQASPLQWLVGDVKGHSNFGPNVQKGIKEDSIDLSGTIVTARVSTAELEVFGKSAFPVRRPRTVTIDFTGAESEPVHIHTVIKGMKETQYHLDAANQKVVGRTYEMQRQEDGSLKREFIDEKTIDFKGQTVRAVSVPRLTGAHTWQRATLSDGTVIEPWPRDPLLNELNLPKDWRIRDLDFHPGHKPQHVDLDGDGQILAQADLADDEPYWRRYYSEPTRYDLSDGLPKDEGKK